LKLTVTRRYWLPALHTLSARGFSEDENRKVFGGCSRLHGHDYRIEVTVGGSIDPDTGWIVNRDLMDRTVEAVLIEPFRGRNLSRHFRCTTGEALCVEFMQRLQDHFPPELKLVRLTVLETPKNSFSVVPGSVSAHPMIPAPGRRDERKAAGHADPLLSGRPEQ
jgi:6-pyruvoyltetrahydropterin/6-carboxytetrahydropterin synthase